ncbi:unnamed protein product [Lasius platythorax]|uniref:Uncharacterized protein n=1 Tax=Lasius platythorax TaxID=488582 RepID=A0AAV2NMF0_9HYME
MKKPTMSHVEKLQQEGFTRKTLKSQPKNPIQWKKSSFFHRNTHLQDHLKNNITRRLNSMTKKTIMNLSL